MSAALPVRPVTAPSWLGHLLLVAVLTVGLALVFPYLLIQVVGGSLVRTIYPLYILGIGYTIIVNRRPLYPAFMLAVFAFSPFLRRVADYQAGFSVLNLILLAPYFGLLPTLPSLFRRAFGPNRSLGWPFAAILCCVAYGSFLAMFRLSLTPAILSFVPAMFEALRWLMPVAFGAFMMDRPGDAAPMRRAVLVAFGLILPVLTVYGIYQFIYAPPWDVLWMLNIENPTFGEGEPFKIRVFSMLNSPGTCCVISALIMLMLAGDSLLGMGIAAMALPLLAITVVRTGWVALAIGLVVIVWRASGTRRLAVAFGVAAIAFAAITVLTNQALPPDVRNLVVDRLDSFTSLGTDTSASDRLEVYQSFYDRLSAAPWGEGYGANESTITRRQVGRSVTAIDSGFMEVYLVYGVLGGTIYFFALFALLLSAWRALPLVSSRFAGHGAVIVAVVGTMPFGTIESGEGGIMLWTAAGLLMGNALAAQSNSRNTASEPTALRGSQAFEV